MTDPSELLAAAERLQREGDLSGAERLCRRVLANEPDHTAALRRLGALEFRGGRYDAAEGTVRRLLALNPGEPSVHVSLALVLQRRGRPVDAIAAFQAALVVDPFHVGALIGLSDAWRVLGRHEDAIGAAHKAVAVAPANADASNLLGAALQSAGRPQEALEWLEKAAARRPADARIHYNLGVVLRDLKRTAAALAACRQAVALDPRLMEARNNLGLLLIESGQSAEAIGHLQSAVELDPEASAAHNNLGKALYEVGRFDEALVPFDRALRIDPDYPEGLANRGAVLRTLGQLDAALASLDRAVGLKATLADAHANRGVVLRDLGRFDEAEVSLRRAIELRPDEAETHVALALLYNDRGYHGEALASCRRALALRPDSATIHRRLLGILLYHPEIDPAERFAECRRFGRRFGRPPHIGGTFSDGRRDPKRRLRVGYLSSDLRGDHPVARNLMPIFAHHDRSQFEIFVYADIAVPDKTTREFQNLSDGWRPVNGVDDRDVAAAVYRDGIDILVCLAGRFDRNRPLVAAYRPAPIQISFHDPATSGIEDMDYLIADPVLAPPGGRERFTERVARLPRFYVHGRLDAAPPVAPSPLAATGVPTFGCFNNPAKLSTDCLVVWARLLKALPQARLLLKFRNWYQSAALQARIHAVFAGAGVSPTRVNIVVEDRPGGHHLGIYGQADVALDPFPFTGSTTTFEALWMGVPVVTLVGDTMVSRWSASMLTAVHLTELAAPDPDAYVAAAAALVADPARLAALRSGLRARLASSSLCDGRQRTRQIERLYRTFWRRRCATLW